MPSRYTSDLEAAGAPKPELQLTCWVSSKCSTWTFCIYSSGAVSFKLTEVMARSLLDKGSAGWRHGGLIIVPGWLLLSQHWLPWRSLTPWPLCL